MLKHYFCTSLSIYLLIAFGVIQGKRNGKNIAMAVFAPRFFADPVQSLEEGVGGLFVG